MIDIHAHILPQVDDGSPSIECSLEMARLAVESGVAAMIATPHCNLPDSGAPLWADTLTRRAQELSRALEEREIPLRLYAGMEIFGTPDTAEKLRGGRLCTLAGSRYPLIEFPFHSYGREATEILGSVLAMGLRPIVAHPERYRYTQDEPQLLNLWADMGCLLQVNRGSLLGRFGERAETLGHSMVGRGFAAFVASDAHTSVVRTPWMRDVQELLRREYSPRVARLLTKEHAEKVLGNETIEMDEPDWFD